MWCYTTAGARDTLVALLLQGTAAMPGCLSYVVAQDPADADALWITEVLGSDTSHKASLQLPAVQEAIARVSANVGFVATAALATESEDGESQWIARGAPCRGVHRHRALDDPLSHHAVRGLSRGPP